MNATTTAEERLSDARTKLLLQAPWFGTLALRLRLQAGRTTTMATDGTTLFYSPEWVAAQPASVLRTVIAHEVMHCALGHPFRQRTRSHVEWNKACDHAVNLLLKAEDFDLWDGALADEQYAGLYAEDVFARLPKPEPPQPQPQPQQEQPDDDESDDEQEPEDQEGDDEQEQEESSEPSAEDGEGEQGDAESSAEPFDQPGEVLAPASASEQEGESDDSEGESSEGIDEQPAEPMTESDWQIAAEQATALALKAGQVGAETARIVREARQSRTDWRSILRRFLEQTIPQDYSWVSPNRRFVAGGLYLPGTVRENTPRLGIAVDTSGSINQRMLDLFASELQEIVRELRPTAIEVVYCDYDVAGAQTFTPDDEITLDAKGGGGTRFQPALDYFSDALEDRSEEPPAAVVYLTDLYGADVDDLIEPMYPTLWATLEGNQQPAPFGETVRLSEWE